MDSAQNLCVSKAILAAILCLLSFSARADFCQSMVGLQNDLGRSWDVRHADRQNYVAPKRIVENIKAGFTTINYQYLMARSSDDIKAIESEIKSCDGLNRQWKSLFKRWKSHPENGCLAENARPIHQSSYMEKIKNFFSGREDFDPAVYETAAICGQKALGAWLGTTEVRDSSGMQVIRFFLGRD